MSSRTDLDPKAVVQAIFMELPFHSGGRAEDQRTAERIYRRVFVPLLMVEDEHTEQIAAQMESHTCPICGLPLNAEGCCIAMCGSDRTDSYSSPVDQT
jgi:hypothetical protein